MKFRPKLLLAFAVPTVVALLTGLKVGANEIVASNGGDSTTLQLTNYPITGPMMNTVISYSMPLNRCGRIR